MDLLSLKELEDKIGYTFKDKKLLICALTHSSFANERISHDVSSYERLEFFGDSILSFVISDFIYKNLPDYPEGDLTRLRAAVVCEDSLYEVSKKLSIGKYILLGKGEENSNGRERKSILADIIEAIIAAMFIDSGLEESRKFIMDNLKDKILSLVEHSEKVVDYKSQLQHLVQQAPGEQFEYELEEETGPDHDKRFVMVAKLNRNIIGRGSGKSKREAEQNAAKEALILFGSLNK